MATHWTVLISVREQERDQQMQRLAQASRQLRQCETAGDTARQTLRQAIDEARGAGSTGLLDVRRLTAQREHITRLQGTLEQCMAAQAEAAQQVESERHLLLAVEQRLEQLERLAQQERDVAAAKDAKLQQRELEEVWQATRAPNRAA